MKKRSRQFKENRKSKKNKRVFAFAIGALLLFLIVLLININADKLFYLQKYQVPITVKVENYTAFNISKNDSILNLGTARYKGDTERGLKISNSYSFPTEFTFNVEGNISSLLIYPKASYLRAEEDISVPFKTSIKNDTEKGSYTGVIYVSVKKFTGEFNE